MLDRLTLPAGIAGALLVPALAVVSLPAFDDYPPAPTGRAEEPIRPNDNRRPAGRLEAGVLTVALEARMGVWTPEDSAGPRIVTAAFAEQGGPLSTPGPLIRVPAGTELRVTVRNSLDAPLWMFGLGTVRGIRDSAVVAPGAEREFRFAAGEPGTYYYAARSRSRDWRSRISDDSQLGGVIVVDSAGHSGPAHDRIFALTGWYTIDTTTVSGLGSMSVLAINGRSWPHTERLDATVGDSLDWRVVNLSDLEHPMHLHGFYFRVDARGDGVRDTLYRPDRRRLAVTELVWPGHTMQLRWSPSRSGNWIFHCHLASHISTMEQMEKDRRMPARPVTVAVGHDGMPHNMGGLVLGIRVAPHGAPPASTEDGRPIRLIIRSRPGVYGEYVGYGYVLGDSPEAADSTALPVPGPTLELRRNERVAVTIVNRSHEPAAVHWHGIELESWPDGVPGWSGEGTQTLPMIAPGDSLTVRFTPPRAGTFMYHSHSNEFQQIASGLYGAIIVRDSQPADAGAERLLIFGDGGPTVSFFRPPPAVLNGLVEPAPVEIPAGRPTRLRLINIRSDYLIKLALLDGDRPVTWRVLAKDGADRPEDAARDVPADLQFAPGEIYDLEVTPARPGTLTLRYGSPFREEWKTVAVVVR